MNRLLPVIVFILFVNIANAQSVVSGRIFEKVSDSLLTGINVLNTNSKESVRSDKEGRYSITANEGDKIIFSAAGFLPDTLLITYDQLLLRQDITLTTQFISLKAVTVTNSYYMDSIKRRNEYHDIFNQKGITSNNRPSNGVGVSISPLSFFSYRAKQKRQLKKKLEKEETESYIDMSFPAEMVERFGQIHGDSLRLFMYQYRPSYEFCRKTDRPNMLVYISEKLKEFRKPK